MVCLFDLIEAKKVKGKIVAFKKIKRKGHCLSQKNVSRIYFISS